MVTGQTKKDVLENLAWAAAPEKCAEMIDAAEFELVPKTERKMLAAIVRSFMTEHNPTEHAVLEAAAKALQSAAR